ncbi:hypothetical protein NAEGRDRAFT_80938 [Naegleria gruberi]|uniref:C2 domain-containing protein n=1 Tax=Naegleria gruberi TaxID=5762 RepID=D2VR47_NAEGR|nr:uncharacterized protein NAEGRDRAFT_80938 [Naegleria gruberi]EFC40830.1 hypothetical protein NAEGRDRAFT_80938 [Naegleria gruberi]|eukprot:XP_002673574.1 hypothetical protein NAEGRDRAFT_80938 [Naegleria gruberi strain NEG-M]
MSKLQVSVVKGSQLQCKDLNGSSDPFVVITINPNDSLIKLPFSKSNEQKTKVQYKTLDPEWNEEFTFDQVKPSDTLKFAVFDKNKLLMNVAMGKVEKTIADFTKLAEKGPFWLDLEQVRNGKILVNVSLGASDMKSSSSSGSLSSTSSSSEKSKSASSNSNSGPTEETIEEHLNRFKKQADEIERKITVDLVNEINKLESLSNKVQTESNSKVLDELSGKMREQVDVTSKLSSTIQEAIKEISIETSSIKEAMKEENAITRLRSQQQQKLIQLFMQEMDKFQSVQQECKQSKIGRVKRLFDIYAKGNGKNAASPYADLTPQEIETMIVEDKLQFQELLKGDTKYALTQSQEATLDVEYQLAKESNEDIKQLYFSMVQLNQLFQDFANLVEHQDELLDCIEYNIAHANECVVNGVKHIKDSNKLRQYTSPLGILKAIPILK